MRKNLIFIVGPTASGKTELALKEARARNAAILSCDSLCVYRGMDIGTAKPDAAEQALVPHYGIDLVEPHEPYSVACYVAYRDGVLQALGAGGQPVIVVGGSGFYLKSFFHPVTDAVQVPAETRRIVEDTRRREGLQGLLRLLKTHNPGQERFEGLDMANPRRVEKAVIRCMATGRTYSDLRKEFLSQPEPLAEYRKEVWLITRPVEELKERNRRRVDRMLENGLVEEVKRLREKGFENNPSACGAIGYREVLEYLSGEIPEEELAMRIHVHTNQLIRKQRTWFRKQIPVHKEIPGT